ncbi:sulfur reduction protein DsrE [Marinobacter halodurans]|uniref:Sulfur reduction protein DsrE n=1 Tax=Marinobacter halodurans TaxID=2528979 RepID=A0ABY1ZL53_9GAMM|nr:DsrE family protein [Marinobacter halodurans]TBW54790.1 sulfur reduction protein DsrE [Marinobacter halodurans]
MSRRYLFVIDRAPYGDWSGRETLDMALSAAAFDQPVALLFAGPGVHWLRGGQLPKAIEQKTVSRNLAAAAIFGLEALYVPEDELERIRADADENLEINPVASIRDLEDQYTDVVRL